MTTSVKVTAHCGPNKEVFFKVQASLLDDSAVESTVLQDGESAEKYVYDDRIAVVLERKKAEV